MGEAMFTKILSLFKRKTKDKYLENKLMPEAETIISFNEEWIVSERPNGFVEKVKWNELKTVIIETTDEGPFAPDVFWILVV